MPMSRQVIDSVFFSKLSSEGVTTAYTSGER